MEKQNKNNLINMVIDGRNDLKSEELMVYIGGKEKEIMSKRISNGRKRAMMQGKVMLGNTPYGYKKNNSSLIVEVEEANVVTMIFGLLNQSVSVSRVSKMLNDQEVPTRKGLLWTPASVRHIAKSEVYAGDLFLNKTQTIYEKGNKVIIKIPRSKWIKINVEPIVPKELFNQVQEKLNNNLNKSIVKDQLKEKYMPEEAKKITALYSRRMVLEQEGTSLTNESNDIKVYQEDKNFSGLSDPFARPAFAALLEDAKIGNINKVKLNGLSDICRNSEDLAKVINILKENHIEIEVLGSM